MSEIVDEKKKTHELYECGFLLLPTITEDKILGEINAVRLILEAHGARIVGEGEMKLRPLAYEINKKIAGKKHSFMDAFFSFIRFECSPDALESMKKSLDGHENLLRYLLIHTEIPQVITPKISPTYKPKESVAGPVAPVSEEEIERQIEGLLAPI